VSQQESDPYDHQAKAAGFECLVEKGKNNLGYIQAGCKPENHVEAAGISPAGVKIESEAVGNFMIVQVFVTQVIFDDDYDCQEGKVRQKQLAGAPERPVENRQPVFRRFEQIPADDKKEGHVKPVKIRGGAASGVPRCHCDDAKPFGYVNPLLPGF
jgi:hypothetical protein